MLSTRWINWDPEGVYQCACLPVCKAFLPVNSFLFLGCKNHRNFQTLLNNGMPPWCTLSIMWVKVYSYILWHALWSTLLPSPNLPLIPQFFCGSFWLDWGVLPLPNHFICYLHTIPALALSRKTTAPVQTVWNVPHYTMLSLIAWLSTFLVNLRNIVLLMVKLMMENLKKRLLDAKIIFGRKSWETPRLVGKLLVLYDTINGH